MYISKCVLCFLSDQTCDEQSHKKTWNGHDVVITIERYTLTIQLYMAALVLGIGELEMALIPV